MVYLSTSLMLIGVIPSAIAAIMSLLGYMRSKYVHFIFLTFSWLFLSFGNLILALAYQFESVQIYIWGIIFTIPTMFAISFLSDSISRDSIDPIKLFIITIVGTTTIFFAFDSNAVRYNVSALGEVTPALNGRYSTISSIVFTITASLWFYYMLKIYLFAPASLKHYAKINLLGAIIAGPIPMLLFITGFVWSFPGTDYLFIGLGALTTTFAFWKEPKLGYVLPFKAYSLIVMSNSGIPQFTYMWDEEASINDILFSGAMTGVSAILNETINKGEVNEIHFDEGILILHHVSENPVIFALLTSKSTAILKRGLRIFAQTYLLRYSNELGGNEYKQADDLVDSAFPFVAV